MRGKKRPSSERARAVGIALVDGATAASEATGIPRPTIIGWRDSPEFDELRQRTKEAVADEWWAIVQQGFRRVATLLVDTNDLQKAAVATAIVADKMLLIRGEATTRAEVSNFNGRSDHETAAISELLRRAVEESGEPGSAEGVPGQVAVEVSGST